MKPDEIKNALKQLINEHKFEDNDAIEILKVLSSFISNSDTSNDVVKTIVNEVLSDYKNQMKILIISYTKARISRVSKLLEALDKIDDKILDEVIAGKIEPNKLLVFRSALSNSINEIISMANAAKNLDVEPIIPGSFTQNIFQLNNNTNGDISLIDVGDKDKRMDLRIQMEKLLSHIEVKKID
jgi:hypothetical protein